MHHPSEHPEQMTGPVPAMAAPGPSHKMWAKRLGAAAFLFFLIKGLLWLAIPAGIVAWRWLGG